MSESYDGWKRHMREQFGEQDPGPVVEPESMDEDDLVDWVHEVDPPEDYDNPAAFQRISSEDHWPGEFRDYSDVAVLEEETEADWGEPRYEFTVEMPEVADTDQLDAHASGNSFELRYEGDVVFEYHAPARRESDVYSRGREVSYRAAMRPNEAEIEENHGVVTVSVPVDRDFDHGL